MVTWNFFPEWIPNCLEFTPNHRAPKHELIETTQAYILWMVQKSPRPTTVWMFSKPMGCQLPFPQLVSWSRISGCHQQWLDRILPTDFPGPQPVHPDLGGLVFMATWLGSLTSFTTANGSWKGGGWIFSPRWNSRTNWRMFLEGNIFPKPKMGQNQFFDRKFGIFIISERFDIICFRHIFEEGHQKECGSHHILRWWSFPKGSRIVSLSHHFSGTNC